jgi:hypothetical protein
MLFLPNKPFPIHRHVCRLGIILTGLLFATECNTGSREAADVQLEWSVAPEPPQVGESFVSLSLADSAGLPIANASIRLEANMTHPGMAPALATATESAPGRYTAPLTFSMAGDWFILVEATLPDGRTLERQIDLSVR